ncbi:MAG: magnesium and cobalt transport protein CorA [Sphingomonadales bacterium]|nr:magnesium and cobalt transport protein CorA [Sphingomonadales bacterium]MDE2568850.1 magnesium and cobalt transport protein CorA [Sphingomonadales bacterium]
MTIVAARRYTNGSISHADLPIEGEACTLPPPGSFDWIGLYEPTEAEMERVRVQYGLHPLAVEDALHPRQLPKIDVYGQQLFIVARTAALEETPEGEDLIVYGQTSFFLGAGFIVSVRFGSTRAHSDLRSRLEDDEERLSEGADYVLHAVLDFVVDGYLLLMDELEAVAQEMEEDAIDVFPEQATIRRIFRLRRQLRRFERVIGPMEEVTKRLSVAELPAIDPSAQVWFRDVLDHVRRVAARQNGLKETLASIVDTASLLEQHRQGEMTRQLAAWAAILALPTAIAGIYGMNFERIPGSHWIHGFYLATGTMVLACALLYWRFRKIGWL